MVAATILDALESLLHNIAVGFFRGPRLDEAVVLSRVRRSMVCVYLRVCACFWLCILVDVIV